MTTLPSNVYLLRWTWTQAMGEKLVRQHWFTREATATVNRDALLADPNASGVELHVVSTEGRWKLVD